MTVGQDWNPRLALQGKFSGEQSAGLLQGPALLFPAALRREERWVSSSSAPVPATDTAADDENVNAAVSYLSPILARWGTTT